MLIHKELTDKIIGCFYTVYNELGGGFLESVYENALLIELRYKGLKAENQKDMIVYYRKQQVGLYKTDIIVEDKVLIEIKAVTQLLKQHDAQLMHYLKATGIKIGFLVNFGDKIDFRRRVC